MDRKRATSGGPVADPTTRLTRLRRLTAVAAIAGLGAFAGLYGLTTWIGGSGAEDAHAVTQGPRPIVIGVGDTETRIRDLIDRVTARYDGIGFSISGLAHDGVLLQMRWEIPKEGSQDERIQVIEQRVKDLREATVLLMQSIASSDSGMRQIGAFEDRSIVPVWTRAQILAAGSPSDHREFDRFTGFQISAHKQLGYFTIGGHGSAGTSDRVQSHDD